MKTENAINTETIDTSCPWFGEDLACRETAREMISNLVKAYECHASDLKKLINHKGK